MDYDQLLSDMTVEEKVALVSGTDFMYTNPIPRLHIPALRMSDGPHGLRVQSEAGDNGVNGSKPSTAFPTAAATASSWNPANTEKLGKAIAEECLFYGVNLLLGPGANIKKNPLCGRNFEYFSEDPYLAGKMAAMEIKGLQSKGVGATVKHFALNNSENYRFMDNCIVDMRAMREIYLKVFERIVKEAEPYAMMCAYNQINGIYCSDNKWLLTDVLRNEWGFNGIVMTDWGAMHNRVESLKAGLDLETPGDTAICRKWLLDGVKDGSLDIKHLDKAVVNILKLIDKYANTKKAETVDWDKHHALAAEIAEDSAVLMKNDGSLPLSKNEKLLIVGDLFDKMRYQGAGSSMINPYRLTTPKNAFDENGVSYEFVKGYSENQLKPQDDLISEALEKAKSYDKVLVFAGLTDYVESEGGDRESLSLPENQSALIDAIVNTGKKVIIVLFGGSVIELPFADKVSSILNMFLPGQNGGTAVYHLLFGDKTPCGKLPETWVKTYDDVPFGDAYSKNEREVYKESIFVGYRYYETAKKEVRYPFGYGLSYTSFEYRNMKVLEDTDDHVTVTCEIENVGKYDGAEIVQFYVKAPVTDVFKPIKELRAFTKVYLKAGECKTVTLTVDKTDLRYWNIQENRWVLENGTYELQICSDCRTIQLTKSVDINGETIPSPYSENVLKVYNGANLTGVYDELFEEMSRVKITPLPEKKPITLESRFTDLKQTFLGRILFNAVLSVAKKQMKEAKKMSDGTEKDNHIKGAMFLKRILESNSIRSMSMSAGKSLPYNFALGFMNLSNGHLFKGIKNFCTKIEVPALPKDKEE